MSGPFVKVFGSILTSTVWCEDKDTKLVWITMLLLADPDGNVWGSVPGIARQAGVGVDECQRAVGVLMGPDPHSRTPDHEGRRLLAIDGGWHVVNAQKYREMQTDGQRKASARARRYRERRSGVTQRDDRDASRPSRTEGEEYGDNGQRTLLTSLPGDGATGNGNGNDHGTNDHGWSREACDDWKERFKGTVPGGRIGKALLPLVEAYTWAVVRPAWQSYLREEPAKYVRPETFAEKFGAWAAGDGKTALDQRNRQAAEQWLRKRGGR